MEKLKVFWEALNKPTKVFIYLAVSTILSELLIELGGLDKTFFVRVTAQIINLLLVLLETGVKDIRSRIKK